MISPELLRRYPCFAEASEDLLKEVAMISDQITVPAGTTLFREGDPADRLYIVLEGTIDLKCKLGDDQLRTVDQLGVGDLVVWSVLVAPHRCTATGSVRKDAKLIAIKGEALRALCAVNHNLGYSMLSEFARVLASRLEGTRIQLATVG
jgi:CRP/FNR family transcriptional regulator, cyclic AMP receptor protein